MSSAWQVALVAALLLASCAGSNEDSAAHRLEPADASSALGPQIAPSTPAAPVRAGSSPALPVPLSAARAGEGGAEDSPVDASAAWAGHGAAEAPGIDQPAVLPHAAWFRDPTCRHELRWWSGLRWTEAVSGNGSSAEDPLTDSDALAPPDLDWPVDPCEDRGIMFTKFPLTADELGCSGPYPPCVIDDEGLPRATRLVAYEELVDSGGYDSRLLQSHAPEGLSEEVVLGYLTECLVEWPLFGPQKLQYGGTPVQTCSMVWRDMAYPVTFLGAREDHRCVWDAYKAFYLRTGQRVAPGIPSGWAEECASWLDPHPHRHVSDDCWLPDGYYRRLSADDRFADYGLSLDDPELSPEAVRQRWCSLLARCNDLWRQVAPVRSTHFAEAGWPSPCIQRVSGHEINTVRKGRCEELDILASLVRGEGEAGLPTLPPIPSDLRLSC